jgi:hypothetical protein
VFIAMGGLGQLQQLLYLGFKPRFQLVGIVPTLLALCLLALASTLLPSIKISQIPFGLDSLTDQCLIWQGMLLETQ